MIPNRDEAYAVAQENISIDAAKYERIIEALLMVWNGVDETRLDVIGADSHLVPYLTTRLKDAGYTVRTSQRTNAAKDWIIFFK